MRRPLYVPSQFQSLGIEEDTASVYVGHVFGEPKFKGDHPGNSCLNFNAGLTLILNREEVGILARTLAHRAGYIPYPVRHPIAMQVSPESGHFVVACDDGSMWLDSGRLWLRSASIPGTAAAHAETQEATK